MAAICAAAPLALANQLPLPTIVQRGWSRHCRCKQRYKRIRPLPLPFTHILKMENGSLMPTVDLSTILNTTLAFQRLQVCEIMSVKFVSDMTKNGCTYPADLFIKQSILVLPYSVLYRFQSPREQVRFPITLLYFPTETYK